MIPRILDGALETGRGIGVTELLHAQAGWPLVVVFAVVTQLGDVWFLFLLGSVLYVAGDELPRWGIDRRRGLFVLSLVVVYVALIGVLKTVFVLPRPPGAGNPPALRWIPSAFGGLFTSITTADGPGFPSGHALGTTMVWGGLALVLDRGTSRTRAVVAGAVVTLVSLARLVLGVHYLVDVLVGAVVGLAVLAGLYWLADRGTTPGLALLAAVAVGLPGLVQHVTFDSVAAVGSAVGGWVVWRGVTDSTAAHPTNGREVFAGFAVVGVAGALFGAVYTFEPSYPLTFVGSALTTGVVVAAPLLGERLA
ncbi:MULTISPECIES: phosphatase PAP2 family protein [Halorussus]|uniref:phosphatase PAP2 family protein n=1 Tax=Halorussus TaxID=1070314 RepID=UPI00209D8251|nr:phosphatase PAP2 family protein [Halorussus vallis]USZ76010.1 phosphatase PAP2 family protein [Halorussus vallis]